MQKVTYEYMKDYGEQDEFVYEEEYCGNGIRAKQICGYSKVICWIFCPCFRTLEGRKEAEYAWRKISCTS